MLRHIAFLIIILTTSSFSQVGSWKSYTDKKDIRDIYLVEDGLYAATSGGAFYYKPSTGEFTQYTNVDGLASNNLTAVIVDSRNHVFVGSITGYLNRYIPGIGWETIPDIARATTYPKRGIRSLHEYKGLLYIATEFGIVIYKPESKEFGDTYTKLGSLIQQTAVNDLLFRDDSIWVATEAGVAVADLRNSNLQDPTNWKVYTTNNGLPAANVTSIATFNSSIAAGTSDGIVFLQEDVWTTANLNATGNIIDMFTHDNTLYYARDIDVVLLRFDGRKSWQGEALKGSSYTSGIKINRFSVDSNGRVTVGTNYGFASTDYDVNLRQPWDFQFPNGPHSNQFLSLSIDSEGNLWSASGKGASGMGFYSFNGTQWTNYNIAVTPEIGTDAAVVTTPGRDGDVWIGTWGDGIYRRDRNGTFSHYDYESVPGYPGIIDDAEFGVTADIKVDRTGNVYTLHSNSDETIISRFSVDGQWRFYNDRTASGNESLNTLDIDEFGNKWITVKAGIKKGILVFNENGTIDNTSDDTWTSLPSSENGDLMADNINTAVIDGYGDVWIGTNAGIRTIFNPQDPTRVTRTCYNTRCNIEGEAINCLAVDPVNNKWIGTNNGVFVLSNDGSTILDQFNTDNSFLVDNQITSIVIHPVNGIAYIGTNRGLSAFVTPYQQAEASFGDLVLYPNPFKPRSDERLSIRGLVQESGVKILSISGNLVAEFATPGGNIGFWDGKTSSGDFAPSGIYYVVAYSADGKETAVAKVAVINE